MKRSLLLMVLLVAGCGVGTVEPDGNVPVDAGTFDAAIAFDAGASDGGTAVADAGVDPGLADGGQPDAGDEDAGSDDAGVGDAGAPDAGASDAGLSDAGVLGDAGVPTCTAAGIPGSCLDISVCTGTRKPTPGLCPGPSAIQCCTPRYAVACDPNEVQQPNDGLTESPSTDDCPAGMVRVSTFCIDRYEASLVEVLAGGSTRPWSPYENPGTRTVRAVSLAGAVPQGYVDQLQASRACEEAGKRLCTDTEWLRACRGSSNSTYPYGNSRQPGTCNDARASHPVIELYGTTDAWIWSHLASPCLNQLPSSLDRTGSNAGCVTEDGVFDMMGNLHEWTDDPAGTFRGGYYVDTAINGNGCLYVTTAHAVSHWDYSTGFRCCAD